MKNYNNEILNDCSWFAEKHRGKNKLSGAHWSTILRFTKLFDEAVRLQAENEKLREALKYIVDRGYTGASYVAQQALNEVKE